MPSVKWVIMSALALLAGTVGTAQAQQTALRFVPLSPCRIADTRDSSYGSSFGPPTLAAGGSGRSFPILSSNCLNGVPSTVAAYSLNVTVVPHGTLGYLTMWPTGQTQPLVSTLNSYDGRVKANAAIVPAGTGGAVSVFVTDVTDVILDINGYFVPTSNSPPPLAFFPVTPCRIADTRDASHYAPGLGTPSMTAGQARSFPVLSSINNSATCNIPSTAQAYSLNFTVVPQQGFLGYLTTWPTGIAQPLVSTLNAYTGAVTANAAIVPAGSNGAISAFVTDNTDLIIDINGYFAPSTSNTDLSLYTVPPCRLLDTRLTTGLFSGTLTEDTTASACGVLPGALSIVLNATVVPSQHLGYLTLWPSGLSQPLVSTLNSYDGQVTSDMAIVATSSTVTNSDTSGVIDAYATDATQLILDTSGYFAAAPVPEPNSVPLVVDAGPPGIGFTSIETAFATVTVCVPGTTNCQTVDHVIVDTGSSGLRILKSAIPNLPLSQESNFVECAQFVSFFTWGPVMTADVKMGGEAAGSVPIQVIGEQDTGFPNIPTACINSVPQGSFCQSPPCSADTLQTLGANGLLGVSSFLEDCGSDCAASGSPGFYYACPTASTCAEVQVSLGQQVRNPVSMFGSDNNGLLIQFPAIGNLGQSTAAGTMIFGVGTQSNNGLGSATVLETDQFGNITTTYNGNAYPGSFIDSGSTGIFFLCSSTDATCPASARTLPDCGGNSAGLYCPPNNTFPSFTTSNQGANQTSEAAMFQAANANQLLNTNNTSFNDLTGENPSCFINLSTTGPCFDWGLPFFFGRNVYVAIEGRTTPGGIGPFWAY